MLEQVNLEALSEEELMELNRRIVERLKLIHRIQTQREMLDFAPGERVVFESQSGETISGVVTRFNRKTVTVTTSQGQRWKVSPCFLRRDGIELRIEPRALQALPPLDNK